MRLRRRDAVAVADRYRGVQHRKRAAVHHEHGVLLATVVRHRRGAHVQLAFIHGNLRIIRARADRERAGAHVERTVVTAHADTVGVVHREILLGKSLRERRIA